MYVFWVRKVRCLRCGNEVPLFSSFRIASLSEKLHVVFCPSCKEIIETGDIDKKLLAQIAKEHLHHLMDTSKEKHYFCPCGNKAEVLRSVRREGKIPRAEMYAIEYYCPYCDERGYKKADEYDQKLFLMTKEEFDSRKKVRQFDSRKDKLLTPRQKIPDGCKTREAKNFQYEYFYQRQRYNSYGGILWAMKIL